MAHWRQLAHLVAGHAEPKRAAATEDAG